MNKPTVEIRVLSKDKAAALTWVQRVVRMANNYRDAHQVNQSKIRQGRRGDWIFYVEIEEATKE